MFGLKEEVIIGLLAAALFVILGAGLYVRHVMDANTELELRTAQQADSISRHEKTERDLRGEAAKKERSYAENARQRAVLASELQKQSAELEDLKRTSPQYRAWAEQPLPDALVARLRAGSDLSSAGGHQAGATGGAARGDTGASVRRPGETIEQ